MTEKVIKQAAPNGWGVRIVQYDNDGEPSCFQVQTEEWGDDDGVNRYWEDGPEYESLADAEQTFDQWVAELKDKPNWAAQARYDEEHGTVNGYDPEIERWRGEW